LLIRASSYPKSVRAGCSDAIGLAIVLMSMCTLGRFYKRGALFCNVIVIALALPICGQSDQPAAKNSVSGATLTTHINLIMIPSVVRDGKGTSVAGLTAADFTVFEDGHEVQISSFEEFRTARNPKVHAMPSDGEPSSTATSRQSTERDLGKPVIIVALDSINTRFADRVYGRERVMKYLQRSLPANQPVALVTLNPTGVHTIHDASADPSVLISALRRAGGEPPAYEDQDDESFEAAVERETSDLTIQAGIVGSQLKADQRRIAILATLDCLTQIVKEYSGKPGRKALVWITGGFPFSLETTGAVSLPGLGASTITSRYQAVWKQLTDSNFAVYPVDARGLVAGGLDAATDLNSSSVEYELRRLQREQAMRVQSLETFRRFAEMTGGTAMVNSNAVDEGVRRAAEDASAYYLLGYYTKQTMPGWHKIRVQVWQKHVTVRARSGFLVQSD
jgi:VWFA-related protein